ncbi:hypothetical protein [Aulosira sp. FACHB-615]|uniref:hypothetical protein n=1 Tax=Aulosira sp. FACHB-615 TaxID=2692777 RepID=UPI001686BF28|nr:hypothetical protein [Aulosira sp. FACHB-615]MBD2492687.1 hypothetical protein [Aulosira sp. FACHB-615]
MTYPTYTQQQLRCKSLPQLKRIYSEIGCTVEVIDRRCKGEWRSAIARYQESKLQKIDEQDIAQGKFEQYIADQAQAVAPEELTVREISFYEHEIYCGTELIASITYDCADFVTQPWVVTVAGVEQFRANTWAKCHRFIQWHHQDEMLDEPLPTQSQTPCTTENQIMAHIFNECQKYGFEPLDDGIYKGDVKLGEVGYTNGNWWVIRGCSAHQQYSDSVFDAVRSLLVLSDCEKLLDQPFEMLTAQDWQRLREYEPVSELVAA